MPEPDMGKILQDDQSYSFPNFFEFNNPAEEILAELGYRLERLALDLPAIAQVPPGIEDLRSRLTDSLVLVDPASESAKQQALVFPTLFLVSQYCRCKLRIEYPLNVSNWLKGALDYLLIHQTRFLVVEAKKDDMDRGFTQLAAEMIALAQDKNATVVYGAVTIGDAWNFARLDATAKLVQRDIRTYSLLNDLEQLVQILIGVLQS